MSGLLLNSFPVAITPLVLELPHREFLNWEEYKEYREANLKGCNVWANTWEDKRAHALLLRGEAEGFTPLGVDVAIHFNLGARLIDDALAAHFRSKGMQVRVGAFGVRALRLEEEAGEIQLLSGLSIKAQRPFKDQPLEFTVTLQWEASALFQSDLRNRDLQRICVGLGVLYQPIHQPTPELHDYVNRFLGRVKQVNASAGTAVVVCRDQTIHTISLQDLKLEASPPAIRRYGQGGGNRQTNLWRRLLQISKVLTASGRRNTNVLKDRLEGVRSLLAGSFETSREELQIPLDGHAQGVLTIGLAPVRVEVTEG